MRGERAGSGRDTAGFPLRIGDGGGRRLPTLQRVANRREVLRVAGLAAVDDGPACVRVVAEAVDGLARLHGERADVVVVDPQRRRLGDGGGVTKRLQFGRAKRAGRQRVE